MPSVRSSRSVAALIVCLLLLGPSATASGSDVGLRALVSEQTKAQDRFDARGKAIAGRIGEPRSFAQLRRRAARAFRSLARVTGQYRTEIDTFRSRFAAEGPETPQAEQGRSLVLLGLRDGSRALVSFRRQVARAARRVRRARTPEQVQREAAKLELTGRLKRLDDRADDRLKRGRTLIRRAPALTPPVA